MKRYISINHVRDGYETAAHNPRKAPRISHNRRKSILQAADRLFRTATA